MSRRVTMLARDLVWKRSGPTTILVPYVSCLGYWNDYADRSVVGSSGLAVCWFDPNDPADAAPCWRVEPTGKVVAEPTWWAELPLPPELDR